VSRSFGWGRLLLFCIKKEAIPSKIGVGPPAQETLRKRREALIKLKQKAQERHEEQEQNKYVKRIGQNERSNKLDTD
jgi:hypothetical protein